jgi:ABC-2 type transport system ATP-binding protein
MDAGPQRRQPLQSSAVQLIDVQGLTKHHAGRQAVVDLTLSVPDGQVAALLGPRGAGKTTIARILSGCLRASGGTASIAGFDLARRSREARRHLGYLPQGAPLYREMRVGAFLEVMCRLRGVEPARRRGLVEDVLAVCGLRALSGEVIGRLSRGFQQRVGLAQAVVHDPPVAILDEPAGGLDAVQAREIWGVVSELSRGRTALVTSSELAGVSPNCQRVLLLRGGRLVADETAIAFDRRLAGLSSDEATLGDLFGALDARDAEEPAY